MTPSATDPELLRALRAVLDPELGIDIVELGLVYAAWREGEVARVVMTMTTPACPMHELLSEDARMALENLVAGVRRAEVKVVFDPPWSPERMTEAARAQLGWER